MQRRGIETVVAAVVLLVAASFVVFGLSSTRPPSSNGYPLVARFAETPALYPGAEVRIAGVAVGHVTQLSIDPLSFDVIVGFMVRSSIVVPRDSVAAIDYDGLMGDAIVVLRPGRAQERFAAGDTIRRTESPVNLVDQVGRFLYGSNLELPPLDDF